MRAAALAIAQIAIYACAYHKFTFVRLAHVAVYRIGHHHGIKHFLHGFRHKCLQWMAFYRETQACHACQYRSMACGDHADLVGAHKALRGLQALNAAFRDVHANDFTAFNQVHTQMAGGAGKATSHRIMVGNATARLPARTQNGVARTA